MKIIKVGQIDASIYITQHEFWKAHITLIEQFNGENENLHVVCEDYQLYGNKAVQQTNSKMETPRLLGVLQYYCEANDIHLELEPASAVKSRWNEFVLVKKGYITEKGNGYAYNDRYCSDHVRDSMKHAIHYGTFKVQR